jgi:hypothetical protein
MEMTKEIALQIGSIKSALGFENASVTGKAKVIAARLNDAKTEIVLTFDIEEKEKS